MKSDVWGFKFGENVAKKGSSHTLCRRSQPKLVEHVFSQFVAPQNYLVFQKRSGCKQIQSDVNVAHIQLFYMLQQEVP